MCYKPTKFDENRLSSFSENGKFYFFLCELASILGLGGKLKNGIRDIEFKQDRSIGLGHGCANHATEGKRFSPPSTALT